jgi:DNA polymerase-3 subunit chi
MTRVDFYVLKGDSDAARLNFACRLTEKIFNLGQSVFINSPEPAVSGHLNELLWTFKAGTFIPHALTDAANGEPVVLGHDAEPTGDAWDVLINLDNKVPEFFSRYHRVAEVIDKQDNRRDAGRERFRFYRERGYELHTHNL